MQWAFSNIDMESNEEFSDRLEYSSPTRKRNSRRISSRRDVNSPQSSFVTIKLYGRLAKQWIAEKGMISDTAFMENLLQMRRSYRKLKQSCKCQTSTKTENDMGFEREMETLGKNTADDSVYAVESGLDSFESSQEYTGIVNIEVEDGSMMGYVPDAGEDESKSWRRRSTTGVGPYKRTCEICNEDIKRGTKKKIHILSDHFTLYVDCKVCKGNHDTTDQKKEGLVRLEEYHQHMTSIHLSEDVICPFCRRPESKLDEDSCREHLLNKHWINLLCQCNDCNGKKCVDTTDRGLIKTISLKGHIALKHSIDKRKRVPCERCGQLLTANSMAKHIKNMHEEKTLDKNNLCDICGKYFVHLKQHKLSVHKGKDSWSHKCKTCGKTFAKRYNLDVHSRLHTGEKPFVCEVCGKGFCQNVELKIHKKNNHGTPKKNRRNYKAKKKDWSDSATTDQPTVSIPLEAVSFTQKEGEAPPTADIILASADREKLPTQDQITVSEQSVAIQNQALSNPEALASQNKVYAFLSYQGAEGVVLTEVTGDSGNFLQNLAVINIAGKDEAQRVTIDATAVSQGNWVPESNPESVSH